MERPKEDISKNWLKYVCELEEQVALIKADVAKEGYFVIKKIVRQQIDYLDTFKISAKIGGKASEDATFARTQSMWEKLKGTITDMNELKKELKITPEDEKEEEIRSDIPRIEQRAK